MRSSQRDDFNSPIRASGHFGTSMDHAMYSPLVGVDLSLLADEVGETPAHSPDGGQRVLHLGAPANTPNRKKYRKNTTGDESSTATLTCVQCFRWTSSDERPPSRLKCRKSIQISCWHPPAAKKLRLVLQRVLN